MSTVPPATPPPPTGPAAPTPQPVATVVAGGERLAGLPPGTVLDATVAEQAARGQAILRTAVGELTLRLAAALPDKAEVLLQLLGQGGGRTQVRVLAADARPTPPAPATAAQSGRSAPAPAPASGGAGQPMAATVIRPAPAAGLAINSSLPVRLLAVQPQAAPMPGAAASGGASGGAGAPPAPSAPATAAAQAAGGRAAPPMTAGGGSAMPATLTGTVAPNTASGQPLVQTPVGLLALATSARLPAGATVTLQVLGAASPPATPGTGTAPGVAAPAQALPPPSPAGWPALNEAAQVLQRADATAAQALARALPGAGGATPGAPQVALGLVGFAAAMRLGDGRALLGRESVEALQNAGRADLAGKVLGDFGDMAGRLARPTGGEWRTVFVPFATGERIDPVRVVVRRPPDSEDERAAREEEGERFVVDLDLSRLGRVQLDGLVRQRAKRFDLVVRTGQPLPVEARNDIATLFRESLEAMGLAGQASFQATPHFFEPSAGPDTPAGPGVLV